MRFFLLFFSFCKVTSIQCAHRPSRRWLALLEMLTPAAKRRRAEAATATLARPFRSPSVRRGGIGSVSSPISASGPKAKAETESLSNRGTTARPVSPIHAPSAITSPERRHKQPRPSSRLEGALVTAQESQVLSLDSLVNRFCLDLDAGDQVIAETRAAAQKVNRQARARTEKDSYDDDNQELRILIDRWKEAGRLAADDVFVLVSERVTRLGGVKAWRAMALQQPETELRSSRRGREDSDGDDDDGDADREDVDGDEEENEPQVSAGICGWTVTFVFVFADRMAEKGAHDANNVGKSEYRSRPVRLR